LTPVGETELYSLEGSSAVHRMEHRYLLMDGHYVMIGKDEEACEIISMTQVLHPNLENGKLIDEKIKEGIL
jgi:hypothetical protein